MKPAFRVIAFLLFCHVLHGQSSNLTIPAAVTDEFTLRYPDAEGISWKAQKSKYLATFRNNKMTTMALLREDGKLIQTETEIKVIALPFLATDYLVSESKAKKIESASILENEAGVITFKAIADREEYWFDAEGKLYMEGTASLDIGGNAVNN